MIQSRRLLRVQLLSLVVVASLFAACSSSSKPSSSVTTSPSGTPTTAGGASVLGQPNAATGSPIKVGFVTDGKSTAIDTSGEIPMAQAAVKYANDYLGGVAGHPITLDTCTTQASGATATACGNQFVQDNVLAVLAGSTGEEAQVAPPVLAAGIPWMGFNSNSGPTLSDPKAFSLTGSIASIAGGVVQYMLNKSFKSVGIWNINTPGSTQAVNGFAVPLFKKNGLTPDVLTINAGTPDLTPQASAEMAKKPDLMFIIGNDTFCQSVLTALDTLKYTGPVMVIGQCVSSAAAAAIPNGYQGVLEQSGISQDPSDPDTKLLNAVLAKYAPGADTGGTSLIGYVVALGLVRELKALSGDVTPASIVSTITSARDVVLPLGGGLKVNCGTKPLATLPSLCSTGTLITPLTKDGKPTTYTFVDPTPLFKA